MAARRMIRHPLLTEGTYMVTWDGTSQDAVDIWIRLVKVLYKGDLTVKVQEWHDFSGAFVEVSIDRGAFRLFGWHEGVHAIQMAGLSLYPGDVIMINRSGDTHFRIPESEYEKFFKGATT